MNNNILNLEPRSVFHYFNEICKIPRPSKKEEKIVAMADGNRQANWG
jgi:di/tripeptidase